MSAKKTQVLLISGALVLFVLLFIAPKLRPASSGPEPAKAAMAGLAGNASLEVYLNMAVKSLEPELKKRLDQLEGQQKNDSLAAFWDKLKRPDLASHYTERQARQENSSAAWMKAGNRYYYAVQFSKDETEVPVLYQCAMRSLNKAVALDPANTEARIMLAACYVEGSSDPMEGINRLRQIERTDSNNVKLQLTFAFFSVKSGQLDKAITRFNKVLAIDSTYIEAYLHLADAYEQMSDTQNTIKALEAYAAKTHNVTAKIEINKYIQQLKNK